MTRRLVAAITLVAAAVALALAIPLVMLVASDQRAAFVAELEVDTMSAASVLSSQPRSQWAATVASVAANTGARVVVVDRQAQLVADSDNSALDRAFDRPEISRALTGLLTSDVRPSTSLGTDIRYVAAPVVGSGAVEAAVRLSLPEDRVASAVRRTELLLVGFVLAVVVAAGFVAWLLARSIARPLDDLADVAHQLPDDLGLRADESRGPQEVRSVAAALNSTASRLADLVRRTERVAADASHHLRTPLTGVRLRLEAIEDLAGEPAVAEQARAATTEVDRLSRRIDQVLALARSDSGTAPVRQADAALTIRARVEAAQPMADARGLTLTGHVAAPLACLALPGSLARCTDELIGNALSYARMHIVVTARAQGPWLVLQVSDDGPGAPDAELGGLFERFARGSGSVDGGSGLGLALVRESAQAAGGSATARPSDLGGLCVEVRFPLA